MNNNLFRCITVILTKKEQQQKHHIYPIWVGGGPIGTPPTHWEIQRPMALFMPYFHDLFPVHLIDNADAVRALKHPESIVNY